MEFLELLKEASVFLALAPSMGPLAAVGSGIALALRLYQHPKLQLALPRKYRWAKLPQPLKLALPFAGAGLAVFLPGLAGGGAVLDLALEAAKAGLAAIGLHHSTKVVGKLVDKSKDGQAPSELRKAFAPLLPIAQARLAKKLKAVK